MLMAMAQAAQAHFIAHRMTAADGPIVLDGALDELAWQRAAERDDFLEFFPAERAQPKARTSVRLAYDRTALYVGIRAWDDGPANRRAPLVRRDQVFSDQDMVAVLIDPAGTRRFAQFFRVNAAGSVGDGIYNNETSTEDFSPDFDFQVATQELADGWSAEFKIPFSQFRYPNPMPPNWSILVLRNYPRDTLYRMASSALPRDPTCLLCENRVLSGLADISTDAHWQWVPHLALVNANGDQSAVGGPVSRARLGADFKWRPRADWLLDGTVNPDFSQLELDTPQLAGNTRRALLFPEKRPFFLEGTDVLESPLKVVSTRSISDPQWGLRATHRGEHVDLAVLSARDQAGGLLLLPGAYETRSRLRSQDSLASVMRGRLRIDQATLGFTVSERTGDDRSGSNRVFGPDLAWWVDGHNRIRGQWLASESAASSDGRVLAAGGRAGALEWIHASPNWSATTQAESVSPGFRADNGFINEAGFRRLATEFSRRFYALGPLAELSPYLKLEHKTDATGQVSAAGARPGVWIGASSATWLQIEAQPTERVRVIQDGTLLRRRSWLFLVETRPAAWLSSLTAELNVGQQVDTTDARLEQGYLAIVEARIRPWRNLQLEPRLIREELRHRDGPEAGRILQREQTIQLKSYLQLSPRDSLRVIWQRGSLVRTASSLAPGSDALALGAVNTRHQVLSVVGAHLRALSSTVYVGVTHSRRLASESAPAERRLEAFVNLRWAL